MTKTVALFLTFLVVFLIAGGQIMFKLVANRAASSPSLTLIEQWLTWQFIVALAIYGVATVMWVWVLRFIPLNAAYPYRCGSPLLQIIKTGARCHRQTAVVD